MALKLGSKNKIIGFDILMTENLKVIFLAILLFIEKFCLFGMVPDFTVLTKPSNCQAHCATLINESLVRCIHPATF